MRVLIVEDEKRISEAVAAVLKKNNYTTDIALDGEYGLDCALTGVYDVIILDVMLPKMDGISLLQRLRECGIVTPVMMLTARGEIRDKVKGLDSGADDYLPKPFSIEELLARLRALGRRKAEYLPEGVINLGALHFSPGALTLTNGDLEVGLTLKESRLLEVLLANRGMVVSKDSVIERLWSYDADVRDSHVESQVSLLRKKLAAAGGQITIKAVRGAGYRLEGL